MIYFLNLLNLLFKVTNKYLECIFRFSDFTVFIEKIDACSGALPACLQVSILPALLLLAYLIARLVNLDGKRSRSIRQSRLVCLWDGEAFLTKGGKGE